MPPQAPISPILPILAIAEAGRLLDRSTSFADGVDHKVRAILDDVRRRGDDAVADYTRTFDGRAPRDDGSYELPAAEWHRRAASVPAGVLAALELAAARIRAFHEAQRIPDLDVCADGIRLGLRSRPLARVGIYVPGGTARYPSSVLMTALPAKVAGVPEVIMVTPGPSAETLAAARIAGVDRIFEIGGAQAVAALSYGTATVPRVDKIVGPGNQWVASAKRQVYGEVDIDSVAGPSEVLILADDVAPPAWVAADLLAQAEHDSEARAILVTTSRSLAEAVVAEVARQLEDLPRRSIAEAALRRYGAVVLATSLDDAIEFANRYAPEHLELQLRDARALSERLTTSGAIFLGTWASEAAGDYLAGANHVLPTGGAARYASPLGVYDYIKRTSLIEYDRAAAERDAEPIALLADVEGLEAHGRSALARRQARVTDAGGLLPPAPGDKT
ncbi:MAG: histidinol dehydrogenase [Myxococcales bacterium]|nr:histidinol dehydrogenase [Myxococcales bacterium]